MGFSSLSAFSRWFGQRFGCSVSRWRSKSAELLGTVTGEHDGAMPVALTGSDLPADAGCLARHRT
ncbi:hypothetical protein ACTMU2_40830 [Cupriavidus basilensis]